LLGRTLTAIAKRVDSGLFNDYAPIGGHAEHRRLLAQWFASIGMQADPDLLMLTSGARHAISLAFSVACGNGGTLLTEMQTYPGALVLAKYHGLNVVGIAMDGEGIMPDALDESLRSLPRSRRALYVTPTMQNPTTATMSRTRREAVVSVCRKHDVLIVEDDVYNLGIDPELVPLAMLAPERTFYANSLSKTLNPTLGIGGLVVPPSALRETESLFRATSILVSPLSCAVMEQWLMDGTAEAVSHAIRYESGQRTKAVLALLAGRVSVPSYPGHHLWMPMPLNEAQMLHEAAAAIGILLTPPATTAATSEVECSGIRICMGAVSVSDLSSALTTLARLKYKCDRHDDRPMLF
jgi:DNA-binding transcriptional MocR family regulator